jgi:carbon storage regulator
MAFDRALKTGSSGKRAKERAMLVLSRKKNESIVINDDITIVVVEIRGDKVRLGVEAPKEVPVHRREVFDAIHRNDVAASAKPAEQPDATNSGGQR